MKILLYLNLQNEIIRRKLKLGKDVGLISFNDTPVEEILEGGISTITTDFKLMDETVTDMIISNKLELIHNPSKIGFRESF